MLTLQMTCECLQAITLRHCMELVKGNTVFVLIYSGD